MNTSFGPRIDGNRWDFHDGIDLPAPTRTPVFAVCSGKIYRARRGGLYRSRHVIIEVKRTDGNILYIGYIHLDSIEPGIERGVTVVQGQKLGEVGDDEATYPHLHIEFRRGGTSQIHSVHPLLYLPYPGTQNLSVPRADRFSRQSGLVAARLRFAAASKREGDLIGAAVELLAGNELVEKRRVDFNDKSTVNEGNGDDLRYTRDVAVEGYQKSNMVAHGRNRLHYGVLVRNIPATCDGLLGSVVDLGGHVVEGERVAIPSIIAVDENVNFEDGLMPPVGWKQIASPEPLARVRNSSVGAYSGSRGMRCDLQVGGATEHSACIEYELPPGRFEWSIESWIKVARADLAPEQTFLLMSFWDAGGATSLAVCLRSETSGLRSRIIARRPNGSWKESARSVAVSRGVWRNWRLDVLRLGTRESTAVVYVDDAETLRMNWSSTHSEPCAVRVGAETLSGGSRAKVFLDDIHVREELP